MERLTIEYCGNYAPKELCTIDRLGGADDCDSCEEYCKMANCDCDQCAIQELFNRLAKYEDMHEKIEKRIEEIKSTSYYPHNFTGQMAEDLEWVLGLLN
nr:hypothetical protein [uncultured Schaedlerella sp.]